MSKYESKTWKLLNIDELPKDNRGRVDYKKCIGKVLKYKLRTNETIYEIKIIDYINSYRNYNKKLILSKFKIEYIYLKNTIYEEVLINTVYCHNIINNSSIGGIIPSLNQWIKKDNYWIGIDTKGREFKFSTNDKKIEYNILHSTWSVEGSGYIITNNLNNSGDKWQLHRVIYFNCNKKESNINTHNCIDHINNDKTDNRIENLRLVTKSENSKNKNTSNKFGLVGLKKDKRNNGWYSQFDINSYKISTKYKYNKIEAKIDNLVAQRYLGYKHNENQFYKLNELSEERVKEVTDNLDRQIENNKHKVKIINENAYDYIEKDNLIGIKTFKRDGIPNEICWVDRDFGRIEEDKFIVKGGIYNDGKGYFKINNNQLGVYVMVEEMNLQNYRNNNFQIDHINHKRNENYRNNLEIVTIQSNMMNKNSKGYIEHKRNEDSVYQVGYAKNWKYFDLYIGGLKTPYFNTKEEAILEVKRRKEITNKYRFRLGWQGSIEANIKVLNEIINFAEEHDLGINSAYIVWKGLDTLENIKNYLNSIDK